MFLRYLRIASSILHTNENINVHLGIYANTACPGDVSRGAEVSST